MQIFLGKIRKRGEDWGCGAPPPTSFLSKKQNQPNPHSIVFFLVGINKKSINQLVKIKIMKNLPYFVRAFILLLLVAILPLVVVGVFAFILSLITPLSYKDIVSFPLVWIVWLVMCIFVGIEADDDLF